MEVWETPLQNLIFSKLLTRQQFKAGDCVYYNGDTSTVYMVLQKTERSSGTRYYIQNEDNPNLLYTVEESDLQSV